jgi:DNA anti-recombination protein RmuC
VLNRLTKKFILKEDLKVDAGASMQALYDIVSSIRVTNKRDSGRVQLAKEHIRSIKRHVRSLNERVNALEEELKVLTEDK